MGTAEGKRQLRRPNHRWEITIKINRKEIVAKVWTVAQNRDQW